MQGLRSIRALTQDSLRGVQAAVVSKKLPKFELVDPASLFIEDDYQRWMASSSITLIRKIFGWWSWARYKPPVCVRLPDSGNVLVVIDGQHTATAAASLKLPKIPVMIVDAEEVADRARAFVGHNKERIGLTQMQIYYAELAAGDEIAKMIDRACKASGAEIVVKPVNLRSALPAGKTVAVGTIKMLAKKQGEEALTRVLTILTKAGRGPIKADEIAGCALALEETPRAIDPKLAHVIAMRSAEQWAVTALSEDTSLPPLPIALANAWRAELGLSRSSRTMKKSGNMAKNVLKTARPAPVEPPKPPIAAQPKPKTEPVRQPEPAKPIAKLIERNGIQVDLEASIIQHRKREIRLPGDELRLVAALVGVMPALLPYDPLAKKAFGHTADARLKLSQLVDRLNPALVKVRLEIKTIPKMGYSLADLGPAAV